MNIDSFGIQQLLAIYQMCIIYLWNYQSINLSSLIYVNSCIFTEPFEGNLQTEGLQYLSPT